MEYSAQIIVHKQKSRIAVHYENKPELIVRFKKLTDAKWSSSLKVWHLPDTKENRVKFNLEPEITPQHIHFDKIQEIESFKKYLNTKRYSPNTVKTYSEALQIFLVFHNDKEVKTINNQDVVRFYDEYILDRKLSISFQNQIHPVG